MSEPTAKANFMQKSPIPQPTHGKSVPPKAMVTNNAVSTAEEIVVLTSGAAYQREEFLNVSKIFMSRSWEVINAVHEANAMRVVLSAADSGTARQNPVVYCAEV